jgi:hypothetical protein
VIDATPLRSRRPRRAPRGPSAASRDARRGAKGPFHEGKGVRSSVLFAPRFPPRRLNAPSDRGFIHCRPVQERYIVNFFTPVSSTALYFTFICVKAVPTSVSQSNLQTTRDDFIHVTFPHTAIRSQSESPVRRRRSYSYTVPYRCTYVT